MHKIGIFVEGQTELITVREFLLKKYDYNVSLNCFKLFSKNNMGETPYQHKNEQALIHYQIVQVGNDATVLSAMLSREKFMWNAGYSKLVGLRDMYSKDYRCLSQTLDANTNARFTATAEKTIKNMALKSDRFHLNFSIMEIESWFLGVANIWEKINPVLSNENIKSKLHFDLHELDPEVNFYHPSSTLNDIYKLTGTTYSKSAGQIEEICGSITKEDFNTLYQSGKCKSFRDFVTLICEV